MNILFLSISNLRNIEDQDIYTDLLREFRSNGHKVYVVCPWERKFKKPTEYTNEKGVHFLRVKTFNITQTNLFEKGISMIMIERWFLNEIKKYLKNIQFDLVIYSTPPITFAKVVRFIKKRDNAKSYLLLKDIFPQNAVDLNILKKRGILYKYFRWKEKQLYAQSDFIGCMSPANVEYILKNNPEISPEIVEVCPNSIEPRIIERNEMIARKIREKYNIPSDKMVCIFGGNLGKPQGIDFLMDCLKANKDNNQVYFVIVGSGTEFHRLQLFFQKENLPNAQLLSQLPNEEYEQLANACDVGLIFLDYRFTIPNIPSRLLSYMQASMPVLAATDRNTDLRQIIEKGYFGFWCESGNVERFNENLKLLCNIELRKKMGANSRKYLEENYTVKHSYEIIMKHFK